MKCPFRTIKQVRHIRYANQVSMGDHDESIDFMDCLEDECPYYGRTVLQHRSMGGFERVKLPVCRKVDE